MSTVLEKLFVNLINQSCFDLLFNTLNDLFVKIITEFVDNQISDPSIQKALNLYILLKSVSVQNKVINVNSWCHLGALFVSSGLNELCILSQEP